MPRNIRPSWVEISVDGRKTKIKTGPRRRTGQMSAVFYARIKGQVVKCLEVDFLPTSDGMKTNFGVRQLLNIPPKTESLVIEQ